MTVSVTGILGSWEEQESPHPLGVWAEVQLERGSLSTVGKTIQSACLCCCTHQECVEFREENWCQRLYCIRIGTDFYGEESSNEASVETVVRAALDSRSYEDFSFEVADDVGINPECIILVMLAEGEPPLTKEELKLWNEHAVVACGGQGTCDVEVVRIPSCLFRAHEALSRLLLLYYNYFEWDGGFLKGALLHELTARVRRTIRQEYGETNVNQTTLPLHVGAVGSALSDA